MKKLIKTLSIICALLIINSCKLNPELFNSLPASDFPKKSDEFQTVVGNAYRGLILYYDREIYMPLNSSTDEWAAPTRGGGAWFDNGRWIYFAQHNWNSTAADLNDTWEWLYTGIATCNSTLTVFKSSKEVVEGKETSLAELRGLRALFYFLLCDNFGGVPIKTEDSPSGNIAPSSRADVFKFIESELKAIIPTLKPAKGNDTYSLFTRETAHALLAKLYLNGQIYTGAPHWADVITQCDSVISSNKFTVNPDYFADFAPNNRTNGSLMENIFVIPYDKTDYSFDDYTGMCPNLFTMHPGLKDKYGLSEAPWNGFSAIADFYNSFDNADIRKQGWVAGLQFNGKDTIKYNGQPLVINQNWSDLEHAGDNDGARMIKFGMQAGNKYRLQDNNFPIFRYADILMMKGGSGIQKWRCKYCGEYV